MNDLTSAGYIKSLTRNHGFKLSKAMGQNFLINPSVCPRMALMGGASAEIGALEIGPGIGVLTAELAKTCKKVVAVELDARLMPILGETLSGFGNIAVINGDIMRLDLKAIIRENFSGMDVIVCANLPYYITSPVIMRLLEERLPIKAVTVMVQKEAAQRLCADIPSRQAGAVTAAVRYYSEPRLLFEVSPDSFMPPPSVVSAVIRLDIRRNPAVKVSDEKKFFNIIKAAFSQRRKTVLNSLSSGLGINKSDISLILKSAGIDALSRAEQLSLEDFARLESAFAHDGCL